ncbi:hypothetical protein ACWEGE_39060 [Amycolatopsis sp. NPDC004747]
MRVKVRFRVNSLTGEVETFLIEDISTEPEPEHDATHDRIAHEVGKVVARRPAPEQVPGGAGADGGLFVYRPEDLRPPVGEQEKTTE